MPVRNRSRIISRPQLLLVAIPTILFFVWLGAVLVPYWGLAIGGIFGLFVVDAGIGRENR